jgi:hypothetical protein
MASLILAVGQASSTVPSFLVFQTNVHSLAIGNYHGAGQALAPLSEQVINDVNRDLTSTPGPTATPLSTATPQPSLESLIPPAGKPTSAPTVTPNPLTSPVPTGSITGTVQDDQTGVGIANALVTLSPGGLSTITSSTGAFSFRNVPTGTFTLTASATGYQPASTSMTVTAGHNSNINLHLVSSTPSSSLQGTVKSSTTGKAIPGGTVTLSPGTLATITDTTGYYGFPRITPGTYTLTVTAAGYQSNSQTITVQSGHTVKVNVSLTPV